MANENPTLYSNFERVKDWAVEKFQDREALAAALADVALSGDYNDLLNKPTIPDISSFATQQYVDNAVSNLVDSAPAALDTLEELAAALGDDPNFATTISTQIGNKANASDVYTKNEVYTKTQIDNAGFLKTIPGEYITETELSACGYTVALTQAQLDTLFPINTSN